ncbi:unnamed protein product [Allacma fusca]|uniref:CRAL-TRIO domain-containing protein n=1 Tax=Allacma fusca TaxID=39272 RepID=A0A8J2M9D6_9HEXA|nr:unnamed protein product [Allacma fusca]
MLDTFRISVCLYIFVPAFISSTLAEDSIKYDDLDTWEAPPEIRNNFVYYLSGFDFEDRPIWIAETGKWDARKIFDAGGEQLKMLNKHIDQALYRYNQSLSIRSTPESPVTEGVVLLDMEGYDMRQLGHTRTIQWVFKKAHDVEVVARRMAKGFMINVNFIGERLINILKPVLGPSLARTDIYGTNNGTWIPKLLRHLPKESLPAFYGGSADFVPAAVYG